MDTKTPLTAWQPGIYRRFNKRDRAEAPNRDPLKATACRNERIPFQLAVACADGGEDVRIRVHELRSGDHTLPSSAWQVHFVDYVYTSEEGMLADMLTEELSRDVAAGEVQPVWLTLNVPASAPAGVYTGTVELRCNADDQAAFPVEIEVLEAALPPMRSAGFYLDLWQHPGAIARVHQVELWSQPHWLILRDYTRILAEAGQKPITACIIHDAWASQTFDPHPAMVEWIREADGSFRFDFAIFDQYVDLCLDEGIPGPINCYSAAMGPGKRLDCPIRYWDAAEGRHKRLDCTVGDETYRDVWRQFYAAFIPHLQEKGWFENTCIAIDEAPEAKMQAMLAAIPDSMKVALVGNYHEALDERMHDYCIIYPGAAPEVAERRRAEGLITTIYTCCGPAFPNTFVYSPLVESRVLPWAALQANADGYLRWALTSWPEHPEKSSVYLPWQAGDTFLAYPGPKSSLRYELLKKGIQDFEAFHLARKNAPGDPRLQQALEQANGEHDGRLFDPTELDVARALVNEVLAENP